MCNKLCSEVARRPMGLRWCIPFEVSLRVLNFFVLGECTWLGPHACRVFGHRTQKFSVSLGHIEAKSEKLSLSQCYKGKVETRGENNKKI